MLFFFFFFSSRRRHTRLTCDWSSDVCSSDLDSFAAWGLFNACFEHKEYLEPYVAEQIARTVLAQHPQLQDEFARKLEEDPAFAANPAARREFFLRRHPSWDSHLNLYPIFRVDELLAAASPVRS